MLLWDGPEMGPHYLPRVPGWVSINLKVICLYIICLNSATLAEKEDVRSSSTIVTWSWLLRCFFTPSDFRSASNRTQFASDLASDLRSEAPFHSKQIRRTRDPLLLQGQSMVSNLCFWKRQPFFADNFKKVNSLFNFFATGCFSVQCYFVLLVEWILLQNQTNFPFQWS